ncbi:hypothetical protein [Demetria terragena]|uniref:hypothetical protein n=1 Tax=Demetria terragena TaxID=63959 RepID=UPI00036DEC77|nr:hypothetical protein [Demetria terragena]
MTRRALRLLAPLPLVAALASCSASAENSALTSEQPSLPTTIAQVPSATDLRTTAAPGAIAAKDRAFGVAPPKDWADESSKQAGVVLFLKGPKPDDMIFPTFSVIKSTLDKPLPLDDLVEQGMIGHRQKGGTVTKVANRQVGGAPAAGYRVTRTATTKESDQSIEQTQYYVVRGDTVYITTMTSSSSAGKATAPVQNTILDSWSWGDPKDQTATPSAPAATPTK